jgi:cysteinyl-tRNA synthetase
MYFCGGHYRQPLAFSQERLEEADRRIFRIRDAMRRLEPGPSPADMAAMKERFFDALADDFNTAEALSHLFNWVREANRRSRAVGNADLLEMLDVLGLGNLTPLEAGALPPEAEELRRRRDRARADGDYATADRLRDELREHGFEVRDGPKGSELVPIW